MLDVRLTDRIPKADALAVPVRASGVDAVTAGHGAGAVPADLAAFLLDVAAGGDAGEVDTLPLPGNVPWMAYLVGIGEASPAQLRKAGAAAVRAAGGAAAHGLRHLAVTLGHGAEAEAVRGLVEGLCLGSYGYSLKSRPVPRLRRVSVVVDDPGSYEEALTRGLAAAKA